MSFLPACFFLLFFIQIRSASWKLTEGASSSMRLKQCAIWKLHNRKICGHLLKGSAETGLIGQEQLLCHELNPVIQGTDFFCKRFNLLLQAKEHSDKK